ICAIQIRRIYLHKASSVPKLVNKVLIPGNPVGGELDIAAHSSHSRQCEAKSIGAVLMHHIEGIDDIAFRFGHFLSLLVAHQRMNVDVMEWDIAHELEPHHDHP